MPDIEPGVRIACSKCHKAVLEDPDYRARGIHAATVARHLQAIGAPKGWDFVETGGVGYAVCPACIGGAFNARAKCPMCGHAKVLTAFCPGIACARGMATRHLHRTCQRCKYDWVQATLADRPPEKKNKAVEHHPI